MPQIEDLRCNFHKNICQNILRTSPSGKHVNFADSNNKSSKAIATAIANSIGLSPDTPPEKIDANTIGTRFEVAVRDYLRDSFGLLSHIRPGNWDYTVDDKISNYYQYEHLLLLDQFIEQCMAVKDSTNSQLLASFGRDYVIKPDIVISRTPLSDDEINSGGDLIANNGAPQFSPLRMKNLKEDKHSAKSLLHASISCKWTIRSDRGQSARTEALNLIRHRRGSMPHIILVTAEPLPTRIATLALGTGDLDCVYHIALSELQAAVSSCKKADQGDMLNAMIDSKRLRDISDIPFDLAI